LRQTINFDKITGLIPVIAQENSTGTILMQAFANQESLELTLKTNIAHYWSRSRKKIWKKGEESGNIQKIKEILVDCDEDSLIYKIEQIGGVTCHLGYQSCFFRKLNKDGSLEKIAKPLIDPNILYNRNKTQ